MCVDYRKLNSITVKNRFPMPLIEEILNELAGTRYFSKLDMKSGYHQVRMKPQDEYKTDSSRPLPIQGNAIWLDQRPSYISVHYE